MRIETGRILQRKCDCGRKSSGGECTECREKRQLQRQATGAGPAVAPPIVHQVLASPGRALPASERAFFEPRFGYDFSTIRVHADGDAARSAAELNAAAYAVGNDIVFAAGQFSPYTADGQHLLAHELAHVVQAGAAGPASSVASLEGEATRAAAAVRDGRPMPAVSGSANGVGVPLRGPPPSATDVPTFGNLYGETPMLGVTRFRLVEENGVWYELRPGGKWRAKGTYDVVMQNGKVWAVKGSNAFGGVNPGHTEAAAGGRVEFAGTISFGSGKTTSGVVKEWTNASGHYKPVPQTAVNPEVQPAVPVPTDIATRYNLPREAFKPAEFPRVRTDPAEILGPQLPVIQPKEGDVLTRRVPGEVVEPLVGTSGVTAKPEVTTIAAVPEGVPGGGGALEESAAIPKVRVDAVEPPVGAAVEVEAVAETEAVVAGASRFGTALRVGGNIALIVGTFALEKIVSDMEQARAKEDMESIVPQIDAKVGVLSRDILDQQIAIPWATVYVQVTITESFSVTESLFSGVAKSYITTKLGPVTLAGGRKDPVVSERPGPRLVTFTPAGAAASYLLDRDITYTEPCKRLTYDELLVHVNEMIAHAPDEKRNELKVKALKLQQLKSEASVRAEKEKQQKKADLIAKIESQPAPQPQPKPQPMVLNPAELAPPAPMTIGPFNYKPSAPTETDRINYLFAKRDYLAAKLKVLDRNDMAAVRAFKDERDTWDARLQYLHGRLKSQQPDLARSLGELFEWKMYDGRHMWELP